MAPDYKGFQLHMELGHLDRTAYAEHRLMDLRWRIVHRATPKEVAFALNIRAQYLTDTKSKRARKNWRTEWDPVLFAMATDAEAAEWLEILADIRRPSASPEELVARWEAKVRSMYAPDFAEQLIAEVRGVRA
ncbi:MAG: hypothetical protein M3Q39_11220 [Actinomycetota bacterium]|nr:hypothetical protein [Actinomycetota bacterium]